MNRITRVLSFILFSIVFVVPTCGQGLKHGFEHFTVEDGLSQGSIRTILQDHNGFMWIGTYDGLNRFDGVEFKVYRHRPDDSTSLGDNRITRIYEDREHGIWVGTDDGGLCRLDPRTDSFKRIRLVTDSSGGTRDYDVSSIWESSSGGASTLWVGCGTLCTFDKEQQVLRPVKTLRIDSTGGLCNPTVVLAEDHDGFLWLGGDGVCRFNPRTRTIDHSISLPSTITSMVIPRDNPDHVLWLGSVKDLMKIDQNTGRILRRWEMFVTMLTEDHRGRIWIGRDKGLACVAGDSGNEEPKTVAEYTPGSESGLNNNNISTVYEDASGALWIGTFNGLDRLDEYAPAFSLYRHHPENSNSLADDFVLPILEDEQGNIWFGTFGGGVSILHRQEKRGESFTHMKHDSTRASGLCNDNVRALLQDRAGTMWIGTGEGLNAYDARTGSIKCYPTTPFRHNRFWTEAICEAKDGTIWSVPEEGGLIKIEHVGNKRVLKTTTESGHQVSTITGIRFTSYGTVKSSGPANVIIEDRHGTLWIGTVNGLVGFDPRSEKLVRYVHSSGDTVSISNNNIWSIYEDPDDSVHVLWLGTSEGLNRFDIKTGRSIRYVAQEGFPSSFVYGILRDDLGRLWLSTNHGLTCFDDRQSEGGKFKNYDVSDGLQGIEFNRRSFCRLRNGEFLFGGTHGVTRFNPQRIQHNPYIPPVALTSFSKFGKRVEFDGGIADVSSIDLNYDETVFAFEFSALNYTNALKNQYAYMMEGFDRTWIHSGSRRYANYTHLDPGSYVFRVKASNNDGIWNEKGIAILVSIKPPFWGTWWFRVLSLVSIVTGLVLFYRYRVREFEKEKLIQQEFSMRLLDSQESERKRIAGELHDSLVQNLLVAKNRSLMGMKKAGNAEGVTRELSEISAALTEAIDEVREIAHNLRPYHLDRLGLTKALRALIERMRESSAIVFDESVDSIDSFLGPEESIQLFRIVQEAMNNILKHSGASRSSIAVRHTEHMIDVVVFDNGKGFHVHQPEREDHHGMFGLSGIEQRVKLMHGTFSIQSSPGNGTTLKIEIPTTIRPT